MACRATVKKMSHKQGFFVIVVGKNPCLCGTFSLKMRWNMQDFYAMKLRELAKIAGSQLFDDVHGA